MIEMLNKGCEKTMDRGVNKVREKIKHRKKLRNMHAANREKKQIYPTMLQEEEKHGYYPNVMEQPLHKSENKLFYNVMVKVVLSVLLFVGTAWMLQAKASYLEKPKGWLQYALTEEFPFARVYQWYQTTFGSPLAFTPTDTEENVASDQAVLPVDGQVAQTFQKNGTGITISPNGTTEVSSIREGVVIFAGNDQEMGNTVIVQHPDNSKSTYGYLNSMNVHLYQFIDKDQSIGTFHASEESDTIFFSIEKDRQYIDPIQVIPVDETQ